MSCGCRGGGQGVMTAGASQPQPLASNSTIEYVVRYPDGSYSGDLGSMQAAFNHAAETGGQARAKAKVPAPA